MKLLMQNDGQVIAKSVLLERISEDTPDCTESSIAKLLTEQMGGSITANYYDGMLSISVSFP